MQNIDPEAKLDESGSPGQDSQKQTISTEVENNDANKQVIFDIKL